MENSNVFTDSKNSFIALLEALITKYKKSEDNRVLQRQLMDKVVELNLIGKRVYNVEVNFELFTIVQHGKHSNIKFEEEINLLLNSDNIWKSELLSYIIENLEIYEQKYDAATIQLNDVGALCFYGHTFVVNKPDELVVIKELNQYSDELLKMFNNVKVNNYQSKNLLIELYDDVPIFYNGDTFIDTVENVMGH